MAISDIGLILNIFHGEMNIKENMTSIHKSKCPFMSMSCPESAGVHVDHPAHIFIIQFSTPKCPPDPYVTPFITDIPTTYLFKKESITFKSL